MRLVGAGKSGTLCHAIFAMCLRGGNLPRTILYAEVCGVLCFNFWILSATTLHDPASGLTVQFLFYTNLEGIGHSCVRHMFINSVPVLQCEKPGLAKALRFRADSPPSYHTQLIPKLDGSLLGLR